MPSQSAPVSSRAASSRSRAPSRTGARHGQATTEMMLLVSLVAICMVAAGFGLAHVFRGAMGGMGMGVAEIYTSGDLAR